MKRFFLLMLFFIQILVNDVYGQNPRISLNLENVSIERVLDEIEKLTEFKFFVNLDDVDLSKLVTVKKSKERVFKILDSLFVDEDIIYKVIGEQVVLRKILPYQDIQIGQLYGRIINYKMQSVPFVTIMVKGTDKGDVADEEGRFDLIAEQGDILVLSSLGLKTKEVVISEEDFITNGLIILMEEDATLLDQIVLTGYQKLNKTRVTGSFSRLGSTELEQRIEADIIDNISNQIPGLKVTADKQIRIRGIGSLYGNTEPLIVVDGFPIMDPISVENSFKVGLGGGRSISNIAQNGKYENQLYDDSKFGGIFGIKPENIESITVLKDAAATSIYGVRAANGVIVIETKKTENNVKPQFELTLNSTIGIKPDINYYNPMSPSEAVDYELLHYTKYPNYSSVSSLDRVIPKTDSPVRLLYYLYEKGEISETDLNNRLDVLRKGDFRDQFKDLLLRASHSQNLNMSVKGAIDAHNYRFSFGYLNKKDFHISNSSKHYNVRLNDHIRISDKLKLDIGASGFFSNSRINEANSFQTFMAHAPYDNIVDANGRPRSMFSTLTKFLPRNEEFILNGNYSREYLTSLGYLNMDYNLLSEIKARDNSNKINTAIFNLKFRYEFLPGFIWSNKFQYEQTNSVTQNMLPVESFYTRNFINLFATYNPTLATVTHNLPIGGENLITTDKNSAIILTSSVEVNKEIGKGFFAGFVGFELQRQIGNRKEENVFGYNNNSTAPDVEWGETVNSSFGFGVKTLPPTSNLIKFSGFDLRDIAFLSNLGYSYDNRYNITFSARANASNLFGRNERFKYNPLWSAGIGWNIHKESWFRSNRIDRLSFNLTYGKNGKVDRNTSKNLIAEYYQDRLFPIQEEVLNILNGPNNQLRYEKSFVLNARINLSMFKRRFNMTLEGYTRKNTDILAPIPLDPTTGYVTSIINYASIDNKGLDFGANYLVIDNQFKYRTNLTFSYVESIVTNLEIEQTSAQNLVEGRYQLGRPVEHLSSYISAGYSDTGEALVYGNDSDGDGKPDIVSTTSDAKYTKLDGVITPPFFGSFSHKFLFKNWKLDIIINYDLGHKMRPFNRKINGTTVASQYGVYSSGPKELLDYWTIDNTNALFPRLSDTPFPNKYYYLSDANVVDASNIRLKYITLGYKIPYKSIKRLGIKILQFKLQIKNVASWFANKYNIDPEVHSMRYGTPLSFPVPTTYTFGVNAMF